jgi:predicted amidohydrolase YtcJ
VSSADPLDGIHVAVNRRVPGHADSEPLDSGNALSLASALTAYTAGSARVNHQDESTGRLVVGAYADLAVLDRDPFAGPVEDVHEASVTATYIEGDRVFRREG